MARSISVIKQQLINQKNAEPSLSGLNSPSQTAIWNLWLYIQAVAINIFEQLQDAFKQEIEDIANSAIPNTDAWVQQQAFKFQYDAITPQNVSLINLIPQYSIVNPELRIVTRCSVITDQSKTVQIKVAKNDPPEPLTTTELNSLISYYNVIGNAGITYNIISSLPDRIQVTAQIYYDGQYSSTIQATTINAINTYLSNLDFNGVVYVSKVEDTLQSIQGVKDVKITSIKTRRESIPYSSATSIFDLSAGINSRIYQTYAGYIISEDTAGQTLTDSITYIIS